MKRFGNLAASASAICQQGGDLEVQVRVFSGTQDPIFLLTPQQKSQFCEVASDTGPPAPTCRVLGFTGWNACTDGECHLFRGNQRIDNIMLEIAQEHLPDPVFAHIAEEVARLYTSMDECQEEAEVGSTSSCTAPVVGPDDPTKVHFDVENDDNGCFVKMQGNNNCYNYGNDIITNDFAQPGRGSGVCPPKAKPCVPNTCDDVKNAAISDGLTWVGTDLPTELPAEGHYVSLHIWPNANFHWLRMDADMKCSHKPGGTAVKNVDNNHEIITDPAKQDFSPWSQHCGYMLSVPSKVSGTVGAVHSGTISV